MSRILAVVLSVVLLVALLDGCGKTSSPAEKRDEREGAGQPDTTAPEPPAPTSSSGSVSGKEQVAQPA